MTVNLFDSSLVAAVASVAACTLIVWSQRWHGKHTLDSDLDGVQKFHTTAVPRVGGLAIVLAIMLALVVCKNMALLSAEHVKAGLLLLGAGSPVFAAGILEDLTKRVSVRTRLLASFVSALGGSLLLGATVNELDIWGIDSMLAWGPFAIMVTAVVVAGGTNAVNIIDGFNGLAGGAVMVMLAALGVVGWGVGDTFVAELAALGLGAAAGFLLVNYPKGRIFLGDGGAYFLGFWVAEIGVLILVRNPSVSAWQVLSICAYPVIEVLFSIYRRRVLRQSSPGAPDALHLHTLVYRRVVSRFVRTNPGTPWKRNAAVAFFTLPWIATAAVFAVLLGGSLPGAVAVTLGQVLIYIAVYVRLVRGRWFRQPTRALEASAVADPDVKDAQARSVAR